MKYSPESFETPPPDFVNQLEYEQAFEYEDKPRSECGVFAVYAPELNVPEQVAIALEDMQHRGRDSAGIAVVQDGHINRYSKAGTPPAVFTEQVLHDFQADMAIGHNRYATAGGLSNHNEHPIHKSGPLGEIALAQNGQLTNAKTDLAPALAARGIHPEGGTDSELAALWIANGPGDSWEENIQDFMQHAEGAYSMALLTKDEVYAVRDPHGFRPLHIGTIDGGGWAVSSETRVFRSLSYHPRRPLGRGEIIRLDRNGFETVSHKPDVRKAFCLFEYIYFSGPDSELGNDYVNKIRQEIGREMAREDLKRDTVPDVDVTFGIPESGWPFGEGYANELGLFHQKGVIKNPIRGRSFIDADNPRKVVERKFNPLPDVVGGKRVCLIDDSIVRSNTMPYLIEILRDAGATEVHVRVGCPPLIDTCHMGVNIAAREELVANRYKLDDGAVDTERIRQRLKAQSLHYTSLEGVLNAVDREYSDVCAACMTGEYPIPIKDKNDPYKLAS